MFSGHKGVNMASEEVKKLLEQGFLAEAQASNLYYFFARKADEEVSSAPSMEIANLLRQAAIAFRQAADEEVLYAFIHLSAIDGIGNTLQNLQTASSMEAFEYQTIFPSSAEALQMDGNATPGLQAKWKQFAWPKSTTLNSSITWQNFLTIPASA